MRNSIINALQECLIEADKGKRVVLATAAGEFLIEKLPDRTKLQGRDFWQVSIDQFISQGEEPANREV